MIRWSILTLALLITTVSLLIKRGEGALNPMDVSLDQPLTGNNTFESFMIIGETTTTINGVTLAITSSVFETNTYIDQPLPLYRMTFYDSSSTTSTVLTAAFINDLSGAVSVSTSILLIWSWSVLLAFIFF